MKAKEMKTRQVIKVSEYDKQFTVIHNFTATWGPYFIYKKEFAVDGETWHKTERLIARLDSIEDCLDYLAEYNDRRWIHSIQNKARIARCGGYK